MKYTEKIHATRLLGMLNKKNPCMCCPTLPFYGVGDRWVNCRILWDGSACGVCHAFIGGIEEGFACPCDIGKQEAIKRTWLALEAKGYI